MASLLCSDYTEMETNIYCVLHIFSPFLQKLQFTDPFLCITSSDACFNYRGPMLSVVIWETEKHISLLPVEHFCPQETM